MNVFGQDEATYSVSIARPSFFVSVERNKEHVLYYLLDREGFFHLIL
jgi:hypothetical protein